MLNVQLKRKRTFAQSVLFVVFLLSSTLAFAQNKVTGTVTDKSGEPLAGVNVLEKGTTNGCITDLDGKYSIEVKRGQTLIFTFIGFTKKEVQVNQSAINVVMEEDSQTLDEVVVVGYGSMTRKDVTSSITTVKADDLNVGVYTNPAQLLQGKVPGLTIANTSDPNGSASISLRGTSSLREGAAMEPYYVIDGVPGVSLSLIAPEDIESIDVLRDASATAIYGSKAANGVIIVTTKKGSKNGKTNVNYSGYVAIDNTLKTLDMMNASELLAYANANNVDLSPYYDVNNPADTNWQDEVLRSGFSHNHNISINGGNEKTTYSASLNYIDREGVVRGTSMDRITARSFLQTKTLKDHLDLSVSVNASITNKQTASTENQGRSVLDAMYYYNPLVPVKNADGSWYANTSISQSYNPLSMVYEDQYKTKEKMLQGIAKATLHIIDGLDWNLNLSYQNEQYIYSNYNTTQSQLPNISSRHGQASRSTKENIKKQMETYVNYDHVFADKHKLGLMAGYSWEQNDDNDGFGLTVYNFYDDYLKYYNMGLANNMDIDGINSDNKLSTLRMISFYGRVNYSFNSKYLFQATIRRDGSSAFGKNNRWGTFPSLALGWKIKEENFLKDVNVLSDLKLRLGWGITGQQNIGDDFAYLPLYVVNNEYAQYPFGDTYYSTSRPKAFNENLKWEKTTTWNAGLDFGFLNGRITGGIDGYFRKTDDLLNSVKIPVGTNFNAQMTQNIGSLENYGMEFSINAKPIVTKDFTWDLSYNITWNHNEITKLTGGDDSDYYVEAGDKISRGNNTKVQAHKVGYAANSFYVYQQVYDENGKPIENMFVDRNGNGTIDSGDKYIYKKPAGDVLMGLTSKMQYKNFDFSFSLRASLNNYVYYDFLSNKANVSTSGLYSNNAYSNTSAEAVALGFSGQGDYYMSDYFIHNASFLRCDNITLGYSFQNLWKTQTYKGVGGRVYATVQNPFIISKYKGLDPEVKSGIDANPYPRAMTFLLGLSLQF